jgi:hypothetical protein
MTTEQEIQAVADAVSPIDASLATRLRAIAARVRGMERYCDDAVEQARISERLANSVAVEHLRLMRR